VKCSRDGVFQTADPVEMVNLSGIVCVLWVCDSVMALVLLLLLLLLLL